MSHFIKRTVYTIYVSYIVPSTVTHFFWREGAGRLFEGGAYYKFWALGGALIRSGALFWSWTLIRAFTVFKPIKKLSALSSSQGTPKPRLNNFLWKWKQITAHPEILNVVSGYRIPLIPLCSCSTSHSSHKMFGFNSSSNKCRSAEAPIIEGNKENTLYKGRFQEQTVLSPQKRRDSSSYNLPEPSQQVCRTL